MITVIVFFIVGFSVILSYDWTNGGFVPDAPATILFGVLVAAILFIAAMYTRRGPVYMFPSRGCPSCRRNVPADSNLCPYCGFRLR